MAVTFVHSLGVLVLCRGVSLSVFSGFLYGVNFAPAIYVQDNYHNASQNCECYSGCWMSFDFPFLSPAWGCRMSLDFPFLSPTWGCRMSFFFSISSLGMSYGISLYYLQPGDVRCHLIPLSYPAWGCQMSFFFSISSLGMSDVISLFCLLSWSST